MIRNLFLLVSLVPVASADSPTHAGAANLDDAVAAMQRGWTAYNAGDATTAAAAYQEAHRLAPTSAEPLLGLTLAQMANREWRAVVATCDDVLARLPGEPTARSRRAWGLYQLGRFPEATAAYEALVSDYPSDVDLRAGLGWSLCRAGEIQRASETFGAALALNPEHPGALEGSRTCGW